MTSVKVKFSPSSVILKEGTVHYQIIHHCKVRHIRTGYKLFPSEWISASGEINVSAGSGEGRKSYLAALKNQIDKDLFRIKKCINRLNQEDSPFTVDRIIELYTAPEGNCTFLLYGKELLVELRQIGKVRTAGTYQCALNSFERYLNNRGDVPLDEMDSNQMIAYESWLKGNGICPNSCSYYMRNLRAIYNRAVNEGLVVQRNPFKHVYTGIDKTKKRAVSLSVIRRIRDLDLNKKSLIFARDIFMFSFYTRGMSFVDMCYLNKENLQGNYLRYKRQKTGQELQIRIEKDLRVLIDRYASPLSDYLLPMLRNGDRYQDYRRRQRRLNKLIRELGDRLQLDMPLTFYVARHSWATLAHENDVPVSVISDCMGHTSEKTTRIYLDRIDTKRLDRANRLVINSLR